jgi:hypothetical protein
MLKKRILFLQPYGETAAFSLEKPSLNTRETHLSVHGLSPYAFEEGQEFMFFSVSSKAV